MENKINNREIQEGDVYSFRYNLEEVAKRYMPYHCFDGTLFAKQKPDGSFYLEDSYWSSGDNRILEVENAIKEGELTLLCNLNEVDAVSKEDSKYYNEEDFITLHIHGGYRNQYFIKKGTPRSPEKMEEVIRYKIEEHQRKISSSEWAILDLTRTLEKVASGDLNVYF